MISKLGKHTLKSHIHKQTRTQKERDHKTISPLKTEKLSAKKICKPNSRTHQKIIHYNQVGVIPEIAQHPQINKYNTSLKWTQCVSTSQNHFKRY